MRVKIIASWVFALLLALAVASPAFAHTETNPCAATGGEEDPGHSGFAKHHIQPLVGGPGGTTHAPGAHQGFSNCVP
jgi:hypothetical protein